MYDKIHYKLKKKKEKEKEKKIKIKIKTIHGWFMSMYDKNHYNIVK